MKEILTIYQAYTGAGFLTILYLIALIYLWVEETNPMIRGVFVYGAGVLQLLFFCPLFFYGYSLLDKGTYYRVLWLLPMIMTIGYTGTILLSKYGSLSIWIGIVMIIICGRNVYKNEYMSPAENMYHLPNEVIEICDMIMPKEGEERVTCVFPDELVHFVRQYSSEIQLAYGRDYLAPDWIYGDHPIREIMNKEKIGAFQLVTLANKANCQYIIVKRDKPILGDLSNFNVTLFGETKEYNIYRNENIEIKQKLTQ